MKIKISLNLILIFLLPSINIMAGPVEEHGKLSVSGTSLIDEHGSEVVLNGASFGWHCFWPRFYTPETVSWLVDDWDITVIRAAMGVEPEKGYLQDPEWSAGVIENVVQAAIDNGIYVLIDWHSHGVQLDAAKDFFAEMAKKYGAYPNVIYEIFNEPVYQPWEEIKNYSQEVIDVIRKYDPDNVILVGSPHWDQDIHVVADDPLTGYTNLMYTVHFYAATHGKSLRDRCDYAIDKGIPIFVSECAGMSANGDGPIDYKEWDAWINWMQSNKVSSIMWSVSDKDETCSMLLPTASSEGKWEESDMKESGIKTRELILKLNNKEK